MDLFERLGTTRNALAELCTRFDVRELSVFGSVLGSEFGEESDVDLLVEFAAGSRPSLFHVIRLQHALEDLLDRPVDLVPKPGLKPVVRDELLARARVVYAA